MRAFAAWLLLAAASPGLAAAFGPAGLVPHAPIEIRSDEDLLAPAAVSGVVGGSGTAADPYVIEGWSFAGEASQGILLAGTTRHVVVRGNDFLGPGARSDVERGTRGGVRPEYGDVQDRAVLLLGASNVTVEANRFAAHFRALETWDARDVTFAGNAVAGGTQAVYPTRGARVAVVGNVVEDAWVALDAWGVEDLQVEANAFEVEGTGVVVGGPGRHVVSRNAVSGGDLGAVVSGADGLWEGNAFSGATHAGVEALGAERLVLRANSVAGPYYGVVVLGGGGHAFEGNTFDVGLGAFALVASRGNGLDANSAAADTFLVGDLDQAMHPHSNTLRGLPVLHVGARPGALVDLAGGTVAGVLVHGSPGARVSNGTVEGQGVALEASDRAAVRDVAVRGAHQGVFASSSRGLDLAGLDLDDNAFGLVLDRVDDATVEDVVVRGGFVGALVAASDGNRLLRLDVADVRDGLALVDGSSANVVGDLAVRRAEGPGLVLARTGENAVSRALVEDAGRGLVLRDAGPTTLSGVVVSRAGVGVDVVGAYAHEVDEASTVDGRPIRVLRGLSDAALSPSTLPAGYLLLVGASNVTVTGYDLRGNGDGVALVDPDGVTVRGNLLSGNTRGVGVRGARAVDVRIEENVLADNDRAVSFEAPGAYAMRGNDVLRPRSLALWVADGATVDARDNWWGSPAGPAGLGPRASNGKVSAPGDVWPTGSPPRVRAGPVHEDVAWAPWSLRPNVG